MMDWFGQMGCPGAVAGGFGFLGLISFILFWLLIILGIVALFRYLQGEERMGKRETVEEILKERYAKGEIDRKEFEEKMKDLEK